MRPIDGDALVKTFENLGLGENGWIERIFADGVYTIIENAPTIEVEPVRHGKWLMITDSKHCGVCSVCFRQDFIAPLATHCRHCGAKMDLEEK